MKTVFHIQGTRIEIEAEFKALDRATVTTIDLEEIAGAFNRLSISGTMSAGISGQCVDSIRELAEEHDAAPVIAICDQWERWHLNDMKAGTRRQSEFLATVPQVSEYTEKSEALHRAGLNPDAGTAKGKSYKYGSAWLFEPLPDDLEGKLTALFEEVNGKSYGVPDLDEVEEIDANADMLNSSDIIARVECLAEWIKAQGFDPDSEPDHDEVEERANANEIWDAFAEYEPLKKFCDEGEGYAPDWNHGETLINDAYFTEYAEQLAEDIGAVDRDAAWPKNCIDWEAAADQLKTDYTAIEYDEQTFWVR